MKLVFVDLETGGLDEKSHDVLQIGAIAVDDQLQEIDSFERKLLFDPSRVEQKALELINFDPQLWLIEAVHPVAACKDFAHFLSNHASVTMTSARTEQIYKVAQLIAHYAEFESRFLSYFFAKMQEFLPARFHILCTLQRAMWYFHEHPTPAAPKKFGLQDLCRWFNVESTTPHEALSDVRATLRLYKELVKK